MGPDLHVLSFDFEEWFHIFGRNPLLEKNQWDELPVRLPEITYSILDMLDQHHARATFFCLGWVASKYPQLIREISSAGHEVAAHSYWHEQVHRQTLDAFREDLHRNIGILEEIIGLKVVSYRAPAFTLFPASGHAVEILVGAGIQTDSSIMSGIRYQGIKLPNYPFTFGPSGSSLIYYPVSTIRLLFRRIPYAGSGYFRLLPFGYIKAKLAQPGYHMLYFHPRDLDNRLHEVREFRAPERLRFLPGTGSSMQKLRLLLGLYKMSSIADTLIPGEKATIIDLPAKMKKSDR